MSVRVSQSEILSKMEYRPSSLTLWETSPVDEPDPMINPSGPRSLRFNRDGCIPKNEHLIADIIRKNCSNCMSFGVLVKSRT